MIRFTYLTLVFMLNVAVNLGRHVAHRSENQYYQLNPLKDSYHFGYEVNPDGNFHHERRGDDGVTYGCYGYLDSDGKPHATYYVADRKGFRLVEPNKPVQIYLGIAMKATDLEEEDDEGSFRSESRPWQALFLPKGCGRHFSGSNTVGPELVYKPPGAISTTVKPASMTKYTTKPVTTTKRPQTTTTSTTTKKPTPAYGCSIYPTVTPSGMSSTSSSSQPTTRPSAKPSTTTMQAITQNSPLVDVDVNLNLGNSKLSSDEVNVTETTHQPSRQSFHFVPYQYPPPPGVPSTYCGYCPSNYGYIGLAPAIFVPISSAKQLGLKENNSGEPESSFPLRTFMRHDNGSWALRDLLGYQGQPLVLEDSKMLQSILNNDNFDL